MAGRRIGTRTWIACLVALAAVGATVLGVEVAAAVKRTIVLEPAIGLPDRDALMAVVELPPGSSEGRHTHPGELFGFVVEGAIALVVEGSETRTVAAGGAYHVAPGTVHDVRNPGQVTARTAVVLVKEKGRPATAVVE